jgi:restriction endonuclease S subunit
VSTYRRQFQNIAVREIIDSLRRPITKCDRKPGPYPYYGATGVLDYVEGYLFDEPLVLVGEDGAKWGPGEKSAFPAEGKVWVNNHAHVLRPKRDRLMDRFLIEILNEADLMPYVTGVTVPKLNQEKLRNILIPLPPLEVQMEIVAEIEGYQKVIDGARTVLDNYHPHIPIHPDWPTVVIGEICEVRSGVHPVAPLTNIGTALFLGWVQPFAKTQRLSGRRNSSRRKVWRTRQRSFSQRTLR